MESFPVRAYCSAEKFRESELRERLEKRYKLTSMRDLLSVEFEEGLVFIFNYGVAVFWGCSYDDEKHLLDEMSEYEVGSLESRIVDEFVFCEGQGGSFKIHLDTIFLESKDHFQKLAISHGIAQSLKLSSFEESIQKTIENTTHIPKSLSTTGKINIARHEIAKYRGMLFLEKSKIHLHFELLDTPEFFWEYPELESYYQVSATYLDVKPRIEVLNKKLDIIQELLHMLADEQNHKHSSFLEWIIIILIAVEIFFTIFHDVLKVF